MNDQLEKKLKELLPYIIITGIIYLLLPLFMGASASASTYIIQLGIFPLTTLGCGIVYKRLKQRNDLGLCLIAPLFYALSALLYGMWRASWYTVLIYLAAYFLCGYLGLMIGDILSIKSGASKGENIRKPSRRPRRVNVEDETPATEYFATEDPYDDMSLDTSTTEDDIDVILNNIHNRKLNDRK